MGKGYIDKATAKVLTETAIDVIKLMSKAFTIIQQLPQDGMKEYRYGTWIDTGSGTECSVCGEFQPGYDNYRNYCAFCGAKMDKVQWKNDTKGDDDNACAES